MANHFHPSLSLNSHSITSKKAPGGPHTRGGKGIERPSSTPLNPHITKSSLACSQWLKKRFHPTAGPGGSGRTLFLFSFSFLHRQPLYTAHSAQCTNTVASFPPRLKLPQLESTQYEEVNDVNMKPTIVFNTYIMHSCSSSAWKWYVRLPTKQEEKVLKHLQQV